MAIPGSDYIEYPDGRERLTKLRQYIAYWSDRMAADTAAGGRSVNFGSLMQMLADLRREEKQLAQSVDGGSGFVFGRMK